MNKVDFSKILSSISKLSIPFVNLYTDSFASTEYTTLIGTQLTVLLSLVLLEYP